MWTKEQINGQREKWQNVLRKDIGLNDKWRDGALDGMLDQAIAALDDVEFWKEQRKKMDLIKELAQ